MITSVNFNIDGMPNKLYLKGMVPADFWESLRKRFDTKDAEVKQIDFYANKFALWIDLRTHPDNDIHGGGFLLNNTRDGVQIEIRRQTGGGSRNIACHMFLVSDAVMEIMNSNLHSIKYWDMDELADKIPFNCIINYSSDKRWKDKMSHR